MANSSVRIEGLQALGARLKGLSDKVVKKIARRAVASGANVIKGAARRSAPVRTGALKNSIVIMRVADARTNLTSEYEVAVSTKSMKKYVEKSRYANEELQGPQLPAYGSKGQRLKNGKLLRRKESYTDYGDFFYFRFIEFGTVKMPARPFLRPAFESNKERAAEKIAEVLRSGIEKAENT